MSRTAMLTRCLIGTVLILSACKGPEGPMGPPGVDGQDGVDGTPNRLVLSGTADSFGNASAQLPITAGLTNPLSPPGLDCYISSSAGSGTWLLIADGDQTTASAYCGVSWTGTRWAVLALGLPAGWAALWIVTY